MLVKYWNINASKNVTFNKNYWFEDFSFITRINLKENQRQAK